ncbi:MAG: hypothetical protein AB1401_00400 [Thermodesulfobacteriota bacterium]
MDIDRAERIIHYLEDFTEQMSKWEQKFYANMCRRVEELNQEPTDAQMGALERLYDRFL